MGAEQFTRIGSRPQGFEGVPSQFSRVSPERILLNAILPPIARTLFDTFVANAVNNETVFFGSKSMQFGDVLANLNRLFAGKFDQFATFGAIQVIMLWIAIVVFIDTSSIQLESMKQSCIDEFP